MNFASLTTPELVDLYNHTFDKNVKKGSYTRTRMIDELTAHEVPSMEETQEVEEGPMENVLEADVPNPVTPEDGETPHCPSCGSTADPEAQGEAGTFSAGIGRCPDCEHTFNLFTREPVEIGSKKKRRLLNPQHKINAKKDKMKEYGVEIKYDRTTKEWTFHDNAADGKEVYRMNSQVFANHTPASLAKKVAPKVGG